MPVIFQHVCDSRLQEKDRILEELRQSSSYVSEQKDALLKATNESNAHLWEARGAYLNELQSFHQVRVQGLNDSVLKHQHQEFALLVALVVTVLVLMLGFIYVFATQTKEKRDLKAQNRQYECDIKEKIESQRAQYERILLEKTGRIEQLEREREQQRVDEQQEPVSSSLIMPQIGSAHLPMMYAFSGMPPMASYGTNNSPGFVTTKACFTVPGEEAPVRKLFIVVPSFILNIHSKRTGMLRQ